jgi:hypothetical protein
MLPADLPAPFESVYADAPAYQLTRSIRMASEAVRVWAEAIRGGRLPRTTHRPVLGSTSSRTQTSAGRHDEIVTELIAEAEAYIWFRLNSLTSTNGHHTFEEIATRIARKRISANILVATGPVGAGGDQGRDAESYTTRIPDELPQAAGFSASASTEGSAARVGDSGTQAASAT